MRTFAGDTPYIAENQTIIEVMYRSWLYLISIVIALPTRWFPDAMSKVPGPIWPAAAAIAAIACGELVLNNPTVSPSGPYCPGQTIQISFTGTNLPEGDNIQIFWDTNSGYNPFGGGGTQIGSIPIDYTCTTCPTILAVMVNPATCSGANPNDEQNEFMLMNSGCGFNVSNLQINPSVGGTGVNDSIGGSQGCGFSSSTAGIVANFIANSTGCTGNIFPAGPGTQIPGGAIVLIFNDATGPTVPYDFSSLCATGMPIYVLNSTCDRFSGAYSNTAASTPSYTMAGCAGSNTFSYSTPPSPANSGINSIVAVSGSFVSTSSCSDPGLSGVNFPDIPIATATLSYTIPAGICGSSTGTMTYYTAGMISQNAPCSNTIYTPPSALSLSIACPVVINPAGPFCSTGGTVQLTVSGSMGPGTWSGGPYISSTGVFNPALASIGNNTVTYTEAPCGSVNATIVVNDGVLLNVDPFSGLIVSGNDVPCLGGSTDAVFVGFVTGGSGNVTYDWDDADTGGNDVYPDDGSISITGIDEGNYYFIVTDNTTGCADTASFTINPFPAINVTSSIIPILCNGQTGGINITSVTGGPPGYTVYDWDNGATGGNDNYGGPAAVDDDQEDISGLLAGTYYLTVTITDSVNYSCTFLDTFVLTQPAPLTVSAPNVALACFGNTTSITATPSGGTSPYTYNWSNIAGTNDPQVNGPVGVGNYIIIVTDANGCTNSAVSMVTQPAAALSASAVGETLACNDGTGDINLTVSGGTTPYTFLWSNTATTEDLSGLFAGTYTVTVTDFNGCTTTAQATITVLPPTFTMPPNDGSTVPCISNAQVVPTPPAVNNSCGTPLTITGPVVSADPICSGTKTYTYTYTDPVTMISATWVYTYTITPPTFTMPANGSSTVACIANAQTTPTPPVVNNSCGTPLVITGPVVGADPVCSGTKTYTWTYTDCTGTSASWVYTYTISPPTFTMPAGGSSTVACIVNAQVVPTPPVVNNSCGTPLTITGPVVGADPVCSGTKTYTWTYTDCTGTSAPWVYTYTVSPPTFTMPAAGASTVPCIVNAQVVPTPPVVNNSCGTPMTITGPVVGADPVCSGTKTYTWTYTDCTGTSAPWVYTYTVSPPTFSMPAAGASTVACIADAQVVPTPPVVNNSCGSPLTITGPVVSADPACSGPTTYTWTYTDCSGATAQWVYTYTISPPTFTMPAAGSSTVPCIVNAQTVPTPPTVNNSCGTPLTVTGPVIGADPACSGPKTYTWTFTDCTGTSAPWVYTYTISPPTFTVPANGSSTVPCISDAQVVPTPPTVNNSCGTPITPTGPVVGADPVCSGTKTYTWTYTDCTGTALPWVYTYTVSPPTFTLPANGSSTVACISNAQVVPTPPTVTNSCGATITPTGPVVGADPVCSGTKTYTWTYTDCTGTALPWVYTYTVSPPTFTMPANGSSTVACISNAQVVPTPPVVNNSCGTPLVITGPVVGADPVCSGTKTYTWTYTDCTGSSAPWVYTYTVTPPTFTLPAPGSSTVACIVNAQVVPTPPAVNNSCGAPLTITGPVIGPDPVCSGTKTYTWTYTDCTGTSGQWVYTYTITPPTATMPGNGSSTVACISDAQVVPTPPAVNNSCGDPLTITGPVVGADPVCSGTKTYTWTYTNCTGATAQWIYTYTITPPTVTMPASGSSTVACISDAQVVPTPPAVSNSCGTPLTVTGPVVSADPACSGPKTYTWTYTDCTGAASPWVYTYTILPPTFTMPAAGSSTVPCIADAQVVPTPPVVNNSCGTPLSIIGPVIGADPVCSGPKTYTWTYTDCTGTSAPWVYTYTVSPSTFTLPANGSSTVACIIDAQVVPTPPTVTNSCGDPVVPTGPVVGADPVCSGTKTYTWTYTDCSGNALPWVYTYTVNPPTFTLPAPGSSTVACIANAQTVPTPPVVNNSCGTPLIITGPVVGADPVCSGTKTYTWTYTDCTGTSGQWVYTYTISPPTFTLPAGGSSTVACISDAQVVPTPPVVNNSCGTPLTLTGPVVGADPVCSGTKTYTWTYTDCTGTSGQWIYTYTITPPTSSLPANGSSTVACISDAQVVPTPPSATNSCGDPLGVTGPVVGADPVCSGTKTYTWTYTDCTGSSVPWVYTYTITPPTVTMPANGSSTVACISDAQVVPTPPTVNNSCGDPLTVTGPVIGADPACSGPKTYTWTYTDCTGAASLWVYTYTIMPPTFTMPAAGSSTVPCISDAQVVPAPPVVNNSCGTPLTAIGPVIGADPVCSGTKTYTWTYTDCTGTSAPWVYTYTISPSTFTLPANGASTVACISDAQVVPTPPTVTNSCGDVVVPTGPVVGPDPVCSGTKTYTWTFTDCSGNALPWVYTYTISPPTFTLPAGGSSTVACISDAQVVPTPPVVNNSCGTPLTITGPVVGADPVCSGTKTYTWTYTDCTGTSAPWVYTYTVNPPTFTLPAPGSSTVACISNAQVVPTPPAVNNSCGTPLTISGPVVGADPVCSGTKTYTWTYTDCTGTALPWVYTYTISPPTFTLPANGSSTVACISDAQVVPTPPAVNNSCGTPLAITGPVVGADPVCSGTKTYTWTYTDCTGTSGQWVYTYTITPPTATLPANGSSTVACISDAQVVPTPPSVNNSCGDPLTITGPVVGADPACSGPKTYTWTYTDCTGAASQWVYTYTISPPTFTMPAAGSSTVPCISDAQVVPTPPTVNNSCGTPLTITGPVVGADPVCSGPKTYTWTFTDCTGTSASWVYTYTVSPSTFTVPANGGSTVACITDAQAVPTPPVVTNSCGDPVVPTGPVISADPVCSGPKTYTWTYTDCSGNTIPWVYTYTINPPTFTLPAGGSSTVACISDAQVVPTPPAVNNSCGTPLTITGPVVGADPVCSGTKTYTWTYTDCTGSSAPWVYTYTVNPPTFTLPAPGSSTVACISNAQVVPTPPAVNNSCGTPLTITGPVVGADPVCSGTKTYTWTYTDCTGTSAPWVYTYTVSPPTFTLPANGSSTVACITDAQVVPTPPAVNNSCGTPLAITGPVVGPDPVCSGTKTYTWTYTDCTGTSGQWVYTYTISPPTATLPANGASTVACIADAQVVPTPPAVNNSCGDPLTITGPVVGADPVCSGPKTYTWTYTDCTGSSMQWIYTYTISPPTFTLPAAGSSTVPCISDAQVVPTPPSVNNSCGAPLVITGPVIGADPVCSGPKTYTWTYTDCTGANSQWVYTYTVSPSTFTVPANGGSTVACIPDAQIIPSPPNVDNSCGDPVTPTGPVIGADPVCSGTKTYTWTYTDCNGNSLPWVYTYTITPPTFTLPAGGSATVACISDAQVVPTPPVVNNSCGTPLNVTGPVVGADPVCSGTKTYTWTYTDCTGTSGQWVYTYTITPPTFTLPANGSSTVACISDAQVIPTPPVVNNSCGTPLTITGPVVGADPVCSGTKTYTWTYTDCTGTSGQWIYTYTITPPTFTLPANGSSIVACISDAQVVPTPPAVNNSCGAPLTVTGPVIGADPVCSGTKTYTWTYTDCTGTSGQWVYTYTISPPTATLPANGSSTVACIADAQVVPTPPAVNNSCGDPLVVTGPVVGADPVCSGTKTYTWTYTDCTGASLQWVYTYTITPPTFTLPAGGSSNVPCISDAQVVPTPPVVNNSCGTPLTITGPVVGADPVCSGPKTYTWTYTDCTGTSGQWVYTYNVAPPTFVVPANGGSTVACIADAQAVPTPPVVDNSCGDPVTPTGPVIGADPVCSGTKTYTWTYTDCSGNALPWVYTYTISPPTFTLPAAGGSTVPCISDAQVVPTPPVVNNSCGAPLTITGPVVGADPACSGPKTYTWTYTDCTGTTGQWVYTYTIDPPAFTLPADGGSTVACISDAQVVPSPPAANNSCGSPLTISGPVVGADPVCSGTKTYTWTYTDCTGASGQWVYTYTVTPPTFTLPANGSSTVACVSDAQVVPTPPVVNNSCGAPLATTGPVVGADPVCSGTKTYTWTYTDCTGTSGQWVYTYTITPPSFTLPGGGSSTVACIADAQVVPTPPAVNNSCGDPLSLTGPVVGADPVCSGTKTYTWTFTDCTGTTGQWVYTYTITPPTFTLPSGGSSNVPCISDAQVVPTPPVVNNSCGSPLTITGPVVGADPVCSGTKTYTWTYTDCTGANGQWIYTYNVAPPTFVVPANGGSTVACIADAQAVPTPPVVDNSCGDPVTPTGPVIGADPVCSGTKTYTWTYTDCSGNALPWVYTYTISPPTFTLPAAGGSTVPCISDAQVVPTPPVVNNSCGAPLTITGPVVGADPACSGPKTYTWTYTDCTGTTGQWVYTYTIDPPAFTLPADGGSTVACISDAQVVPTPPTANNSCGTPLSIAGPVIGADPSCSGPKTYTWTYTDCTGASGQWVYTYTVSPPTFTMPANGGSTVACVSDAQVVPTPPVVNNSCGVPMTISGPVVGADPVCSGTKTYTWTYTDCTGATGQWVYTYTVTPPSFTLPAGGNSTVACIADAQVVPTPPVVNNSCGDPLTLTGPVVGADPVCSGPKTYTWTYTDCTGTTGQWVYTYTISPPTFTLPAGGSSNVPCISDAQVVPTPPVVNNSCGAPLTITGPVVGADPVCSGTKTYTWTYTDCTGTTGQWIYTYNVAPPTFVVPANGGSTVACIADAQAVPTPPVVDNSCGDPVTPTGPVIGADPVCSGTKTYTWTFTDCNGNALPWVYTYTINPPTFTLPAAGGSTVPCISDAQVVPTPPVVNNSCGAPLTITGPVVGADPACSGPKTYTWTYTDCTGTTGQWVYTYTIDPPAFTLPPDGGSSVACISDAQVVPTPPTANNSCGTPLSIAGPVIGADPVCSGTKTYTWTFTDCTGASGQWVYTYTVSPPTFTMPADGGSTVACVSDAQVVPTPPVVNNSCGTPMTISGPVIGSDPVCSGTKTYTWTYTDCTGATAQWVYTYTINPPTETLPANGGSTVACIADAQVVPTPPVVNNSCGDPLTITGPVVGADPVCSGTKTYTWTYTNCTGASSQWEYTYTVSPPTFTLPAGGSSSVPCNADAQVVPTPPVVNNSCGTPLTITGPVVGPDPVCSGPKTYTWTYTDCTGTTGQWIYTYNVAPSTFIVPADGGSTVNCLSDAQVVPTPPVVDNSCGDPVVPTGPVIGADPVCSGTKTYTWTYTDCNGNALPWNYVYTITPPVFTLPADDGSTVPCIGDAQLAPVPPVVTNSCGDLLVASGPAISPDPLCSGIKTYTWTYTDCSGASADWVYTYTITPPTFTMPADDGSSVNCISDAQVVPTPPAVSNSCGVPLSLTGPIVGADPICSGTKTYTWDFTDCTGTSGQWVYTYTILPPTNALPPDDGSTVACISDAQVVPTPPSATNSCGDLLTVTGPVVGADPACSGTKTYTWTYMDCTGSSTPWTYTYTINPPTMTLPADGGSTVACILDAQVLPTPPSATNSCGVPLTITGPVIGPDPVCSGTKTYTWTYTDCTGTTGQWIYTYTINPPTITLPADDGSTVDCIADAQTVPTPPVVTNSCGDPASVSGPVIGADPACSGTKTYTWTYTDCTGSSADWTYTYTIIGDTGPVFDPAPADVSVSCVQDIPPMIQLGYTSNCGTGGIVSGSDSAINGSCPATVVRTWTFTDACGNVGTATQNITVNDITPPTATNPSPINISGCNSPVPAPDISVVTDAADDCGVPVVAFAGDVTDLVGCTETTTRSFTVTDACNNSITLTQLITRTVDTTPPVFTNPPANVTVDCINQVPAMTDLSYTDNCSPAGTVMGTETGPSGNPLTITRTWTFTDGCGNPATVTQTITISDIVQNTNLNDQICQGDIYTLPDGNTTSTAGMYGPYTFTGSTGCDSIVNVNLTVNLPTTGTETYVGCQGDGYSVVVNGTIYDQGNPNGVEILTGSNGCDSVVTITLTFHPTSSSMETYNGCSGDGYSVIVNGIVYDESNPMGTEVMDNVWGCDSTITVNLFFGSSGSSTQTYQGCEGDGYSIVVNGTVYDQMNPDGIETFPGGNGCDSTVNINLDFFPATEGMFNYAGCTGDGFSITIGGTVFDETNPTGTATITNVNGCDSIVMVDLSFSQTMMGNETYMGCQGDGYFVIVNGTVYDEGNPVGTEVITGAGCDSIVNIDLQFDTVTQAQITPLGPLCTAAGIQTLDATPAGGTWSGDVSSDQFDPALFGPGTYEVIYTFTSGACSSADTITISVYELTISCSVLQNESAAGASDGRGEVTISGGVPPYDISWSGPVSGSVVLNADGSFVIPSLPAGVYTVEVEDATGCIVTCQFTITSPVPCVLTIDSINIIDAICPGVNDGRLTVNASGNMPPFEYSIDGGPFGPSNMFAGVEPGTHTITVRDAVGCLASQVVTVGVGPGPDLSIVDITDASCGLNNGSFEVVGSNGTPLYNYSDDGIVYGLSGVFTGLGAGTYLAYLIDGAGCTDTIPVSVAATNAPVIDNVPIQNSSCGNSDGSLTIIASGGQGILMFSIDGGVTFQASNFFDNLPSGVYPLQVMDEAGCFVNGSATISDIGAPVITNIAITPTSCGVNDGKITVTATGTPTLEYSINGTTWQTSNMFVSLASGAYTVFVRDGNGCMSSQSVTVNTTNGPQINNVMLVHTSCGDENGEITVIATGGTGALEYFLDGDSNGGDNHWDMLDAGTYIVEVSDDNGCTATDQVTINPSEAPDFDRYTTDAHCGHPDGTIEVEGFDGIPPYLFSFNGGPFLPVTFWGGLASDFYTIVIRDAAGCEFERDVFVGEDGPPVISMVNTSDPDCGMTNGSIEIIATAAIGSGPLEYSITTPPVYQSSNVFDPVAPGTYTITVRDQFNCITTAMAVIAPKPNPVISNLAIVNSDCGMTNGSITVTATNGAPAYMYSINGGAFGNPNVFTGLGAGTYTIVVRDTKLCTDTATATIISVGTQYGALADAICQGDEYIIEGDTFVTGGVYNIPIAGGASNGCDSVLVLTLTVNSLETSTLDTTICIGDVFTYNGIDYNVAGVYVLDTLPAVTGCDTILSLNLSIHPLDTTYLDETICHGGVYTINGMDYTVTGNYLIDTIPGTIGCDSVRILRLVVEDYNQRTIVEGICEGEVYTINGIDYTMTGFYVIDTVTGPGGCDTIVNLDLTVSPLPVAGAGADKVLDCQVQSVALDGTATGGTPLWSGPGINAGNQNQVMPVVSVPGIYILTVTSGQNCDASDTVIVTLDPEAVIADAGADAFFSCDIDTIVLQASPVGPNYSYQWAGPGINATNEHLANPIITVPGTYTLVVTDNVSLCISLPDTVEITDISVVIVAIIKDPDDLTCYITSVDLDATGSSTGPSIVYTWFDEEGNLVSSSPGFPVSSGGMFTLIVEDTISGCFDDDSIMVKDLTEYPPVDAGPDQVLDCNHPTVILNENGTNPFDDVVFQWTGPAGGILSPDTLLSILVGTPGEYILMGLDTATGCSNEDTAMVLDMTTPPFAEINIVEHITCIDSIALLDVGGSTSGAGVVYAWFGPGFNNVNSDTIEPTNPGLFILNVTDQGTGCDASDSVRLTLPSEPQDLLADIDLPFCAGDSSGVITVTTVTGGTPDYMYALDGGALQSVPTFLDLVAGNYTIHIVDANGCAYSELFTVPDGIPLTIDIGPDIDLVLGDSVILWADVSLPWSQIDSIVWTPLDILSCEYCTNPTLYGLHDDVVTATVYTAGCVDEDMLTVRVDVDANIYIPNVFSPNDDGINDYVTVFTDNRVRRIVYLEIFDRWGNQVFVGENFLPNDPLKGWDGSFRGKKMNPAVFAYIARVELINGDLVDRKGDITIIR